MKEFESSTVFIYTVSLKTYYKKLTESAVQINLF